MQISEVIRAAIPNATIEDCEYILWERTPFPCGAITAKQLYKASSSYKRACANKIELCDYCDNKAVEGKYLCQSCKEALQSIAKEEVS